MILGQDVVNKRVKINLSAHIVAKLHKCLVTVLLLTSTLLAQSKTYLEKLDLLFSNRVHHFGQIFFLK